jgi:hypothetical protein
MKKLLVQLMCLCALLFALALGAVAPASAQSPEDVRTQLLNLTDAVQELSAVAPKGVVNYASLQSARARIEQMSGQDLAVFGKSIDPSMFSQRLTRARKAVRDYSQSAASRMSAGPSPMDSDPFPVANGLCTSANGSDTNRLPTSVVLAADVTYFVAEGVKEAATDACNQVGVVVVAGEGGGANTSLACIATDAIYVVAHAVDEGIHFCDDDLTGAVVDANYARLDDIHTDVNGVDSDLNNGFSSLGTQVSAVDTHIASEFSALSAQMTTLIGGLSAQLTATQAQLTVTEAQLVAARNELVAGQYQIMKENLTPDGQKVLAPSILTCTGDPSGPASCPNVLDACGPNGCSWNHVGKLP